MLFLLDTNILLGLIKETSEEDNLNRLHDLVEGEQVKLLVPSVLEQEWERKKRQTVLSFESTFKKTASISNSLNVKDQFQDDLEIMKEKVQKVDFLISRGIRIKLENRVVLKVSERSIAGKAPFHGEKTKTEKDAYIYFSTVDYLKTKKEDEFVFVTKDIGDYTDPENRAVIHPELIDESIIVIFFPALSKCLRDLKANNKLSFSEYGQNGESKYEITVCKQGKRNLLEHLYEVFTVCQSKMAFIPPSIFCRINPLRVSIPGNNYSYYSNYTLHTNNSEIISFFKEVEIEKGRFKKSSAYKNTKNNVEKLKYLIDVLERQLIFSIKSIDKADEVKVNIEHRVKCTCAQCLYFGLQWDKISTINSNSEDRNKNAMVQFQLGNGKHSFRLFYECYKEAKEKRNRIMEYRLKFVLQWVKNYFILNNNSEIERIKVEIEKFDLNNDFFKFANSPKLDRELASFLHDRNMISEFTEEIRKINGKIREHYNSQLKASYSSNSNLWNLVCEFAVFENFTLANGMTYTRYSEFTTICKEVAEGIFMSYSLNEYQPSRLKYFDDHILRLLLFYTKAEDLIILFNKYVKSKIKYQGEETKFLDIIYNFLELNFEEMFIDEDGEWYGKSDRYFEMYWNLLLLSSIVEFDKIIIQKVFDHLIPVLEKIPKNEVRKLHHVASVIHSNGELLGFERVKYLYSICLNNVNLHNQTIFGALAVYCKKNQLYFIDTDIEFQQFCSSFLEKCELCQEFHENILFESINFISPPYVKRLEKLLIVKLERNFDPQLYYLASIYDILDYQIFFDKYLQLFEIPLKKEEFLFFGLSGEVKYSEINKLMNLCFKNKVRPPEEFFEKFRVISEYYEWIMDMGRFDYVKFNPLWILQYSTKYFLREIFALPQARLSVREYLKKNNQPTLANYYVEYVND